VPGPPMIVMDTDDVIRRIVAGESVKAIAKSLGTCDWTVAARLADRGLTPRGIISRARDERFPPAEIARRYLAGESELALSIAYGTSRTVIARVLRQTRTRRRTQGESTKLWLAEIGKEGRLRLTEAAHAAVRGRKQSFKFRCKIASSRSANAVPPAPDTYEGQMWRMLADAGLSLAPQHAVGPYNIDIAVTESRVAVEIFGGHWHATGRHAARYPKRLKYLLDRGWHVVIVWVKRPHWNRAYRLSQPAADYVISLHQRIGRQEPIDRQEHVLRGDGYLAAPGEYDPNNGAFIPRPHRVSNPGGADPGSRK